MSPIIPKALLKWVWGLAALLVGPVLALEFLFDLGKEATWRTVVVSMDVALVAGYALLIFAAAIRSRKALWRYILSVKIDIFVLLFVLSMLHIPRFAAAIVGDTLRPPVASMRLFACTRV